MDGIAFNNRSVLDEPKKERVIYVGDSYGNNNRTNPWTDVFTELAGLDEMTSKNVCQGGIGWIKGTNSHNFYDRIVMARNQIPWDPKLTTKIIVVGGVFSDFNQSNYSPSAGTLKTLFNEFADYCHDADNFPYAKIYYGFPSVCTNTAPVGAIQGPVQASINAYRPFYESQIKASSIVWLANIPFCIMRNSYLDLSESGQLHPSGDGGLVLGQSIYSAIYSGYFRSQTENLTLDVGADATATRFRLNLTYENNVIKGYSRDSVVVNASHSGTYQIAKLPDNLSDRNYINNFNNFELTCKCLISKNGVNSDGVVVLTGNGRNLNLVLNGSWSEGDKITIYTGQGLGSTDSMFINYQ